MVTAMSVLFLGWLLAATIGTCAYFAGESEPPSQRSSM